MRSLFLALCLAATSIFGAQVTLTWQDNANNETGHKVERATGAGTFSQIGTSLANVATYVDTTVVASTTYNYRVRATNAAGDSAYSNTATVTTLPPSNTAPTISDISDRSIAQGTNTGAIAFTVGDAETAAGSLTVTRASSNTTLVPVANIVLGGSGADRTVTVTPVAGQVGTATITITVSDGTLSTSDTFVLTVTQTVPGAPTGLTISTS